MGRSVRGSELIAQQIEEALASSWDAPERMLDVVGRLGARLIIQKAMEAEVDSLLERVPYERAGEDGPVGYRNGQRPVTVQTSLGELELYQQKLRGLAEPFVSTVMPRGTGKRVLRTEPLRALVIGAYVRGLSTRDIESLLAEVEIAGVSRQTVSEVCRDLRAQYDAFRERRLDALEIVCLFMDGVWLPLRPDGGKEGVLCAWGITQGGDRVLVDLSLGCREAYDDWLEFGRGIVDRGLPTPLMIVTDGAGGLVKAVTELWPSALRQRCCMHKLANVLAKIADDELQKRVKKAYWQALDEAHKPQQARDALTYLARDLKAAGYDSASKILLSDLGAVVAHLRMPLRHRKRWRTTNLLERSFGEVRRRTKVIGRFPGETSCLSLVWAVLDLQLRSSNGVRFTDLEQQQLQRLKHETTAADTQPRQAAA